MTYSPFPDFYFSAKWLSYSLPFLLIFTAIIALKLYDGKNVLIKTFYIFLFPFALFLLILAGSLNPMFLGYGEPVEITALNLTKKELVATDYILTMGGKMSRGIPYFRVHILDPETGSKKIRIPAGERGEFAGITGDTLIFAHYNEVTFHSLSTGRVLLRWNKETLPALFPQLSPGIDNADWRWQRFYITVLDGTKWMMNPLSQTIGPDKGSIPDVPKELSINNNVLLYNDRVQLLELQGINGNDQIRFLTFEDSAVNKNLSFLHGNLAGFSSPDKCVIIRHYGNTLKTEFIYSCVSMDGKTLLWQIPFAALYPAAKKPEREISSFCTVDEGRRLLFISSMKEVIALNIKTGAIVWRTAL